MLILGVLKAPSRNTPERVCDTIRIFSEKNGNPPPVGDWDRGVKTYRTLEGGGELAPKVAPRRLGLLTPKLTIFFRISVERGQFQGPWKFKIFTPPLIFGDLTPPPLSQSPTLCGKLSGLPSLNLISRGRDSQKIFQAFHSTSSTAATLEVWGPRFLITSSLSSPQPSKLTFFPWQ